MMRVRLLRDYGLYILIITLAFLCNAATSSIGIEKKYDFVFGWSTGHVGTTSLSSAEAYNDPQNIKFIFEANRHPSFVTWLKEKWKNFTHENELEFVKSQFIPLMVQMRHNATTLVDLGHHNLYFIYGLLKYMKLNPFKYKILFVRIRRERYESALSLSYSSSRHSVCNMLFRYCPYDRQDDIILKLKNMSKWNTEFSDYHKALWLVDEVEARWQYLLKVYSSYIQYIEVYWSKFIPNSLNQAALNISIALQLSPCNSTTDSRNITVPHTKYHSYQSLGKNDKKQRKEIEKIKLLDSQYQLLMKSD